MRPTRHTTPAHIWLDGTPLRSDGKLTIVSLAVELGVKRHVLSHKHTDLRDLFYARVKARNGVTASEALRREQNGELRRRLDTLHAERDEYRQATDALARALNVQTVENDALRAQLARLRQHTGPTKLTTPARRRPLSSAPSSPPSTGMPSMVDRRRPTVYSAHVQQGRLGSPADADRGGELG